MKVLLLVNQAAMRYRMASFDTINSIFLQIIHQIQVVMGAISPNKAPGDTPSEEQREAAELQKSLIDMVQCFVVNPHQFTKVNCKSTYIYKIYH